eukprot:1104467_1
MAKQSDGLLVITDNKQNDATCTLKSALWDYHPFKKGELKYYTQEFALLDGKWKIQCSGNKEGLNIYFQSVCLPKNSSALGINYHLRLVSRNRTIQTLHSAAFITNNKWIRFDDTIRYTDLGDDLTMTLQMDVTTTYEKGWINWKVCGNLLRHFRSSPDTQYNSAFVTINGVDWQLCCRPSVSNAGLELRCEGASAYGEVIGCIKCTEAGVEQTKTESIRSHTSISMNRLLKHAVFNDHDEVTIQAKICPTLVRNLPKQSVTWSFDTYDLNLRNKLKACPPFMINGMTWTMNCNSNCIELSARQYISGTDIIKTVRVRGAIECEELNICEQRAVDYVNHNGRWTGALSCAYDKTCLDKRSIVTVVCRIWLLSIEYKDTCVPHTSIIEFDQANTVEKEMKTHDHEDDIEYAELYDKHRNIIHEWNQNSNTLRDISLMDDKSFVLVQPNDDDDDEKKAESDAKLGVQLLDTYLTYHPMIKEQTERLTKVTTDQYLLELINHQNQLSKSMKECETSVCREYELQSKQYEVSKQKRVELQNNIKKKFAECNVMIKRENELVQQLQDTMQGKLQIEALRVSSRTCVTVIKSYNDFMKNNKQYMDDIRDKFERLWGEFESKWMKWNVEDVISWFKYKTTAMETGTKHDIDWDKTEKQLKSRNISGKALQKFNDLTFEFIGIQDFEVVDHLVCAIKELREKYSKGNKEENVDKNKQIPKEYLCPITKQIMQDPVIAFDGHNYDRNAIESYLKIHQTSPITGATADYLIVFPNHKLKTDISQYVTAHSIDLETQNEANGEGENETAYV